MKGEDKQEFWAPSDDKPKQQEDEAEIEFYLDLDPDIFDVDNWF